MNITNHLGLSVDFLENGLVKCIEAAPIRISLKQANLFAKAGTNIYLRNTSGSIDYVPLTGPESTGSFTVVEGAYISAGSWNGLNFTCSLQLSKQSRSWQWLIQIENNAHREFELDLVYQQDVGLKPISDGLINEYYISQYLERRILQDAQYGSVICCRQNMKESVGNPWIMLACSNKASSACVDGMQFYGKSFRETGIPESLTCQTLGGEYSGESSVVALQEKTFVLKPGEKHTSSFTGTYQPDHILATSETDLELLTGLLHEFENNHYLNRFSKLTTPTKNLFNISPFLPVDDLDDSDLQRYFGSERRQIETHEGKLLSFFTGLNKHVVLRNKEILADRPHGHIMQAQAGLEADENIVSTTSFAFGVFNSHVTQGNTNFNIFLSVCATQFNQSAESGQRIFVEIEGKTYLLGVPSAFETGLNHCRWIYKHQNYCFQVRTWTSKTSPRINFDFKVLDGENVNLIVTHQFDEGNGWKVDSESETGSYKVKPKAGSMIAEKFPLAQFSVLVNSKGNFKLSGSETLFSKPLNNQSNLLVFEVSKTGEFSLSFIGEVCKFADFKKITNTDQQFEADCADAQLDLKSFGLGIQLNGNQGDIAAISEILPWFGINAITHYLTPHGLEQFGGAAWGTRDVSQGPFDLLMCLQKYSAARKLLLTIFSNQNTHGDWPQWWMFDSYFNIRAGDCHGDVYYWCLISLSNYIKVTGDVSILSEVLPYYHEEGVAKAEKTPLSEHVNRLIKMITDSFISGTALVPFGGGDWNDSLQPVSKKLAERMISSWTVEMNYQAFNQYQYVFELAGNKQKAAELKGICERIKSDFNKFLIKDKVVAGYGLLEDDGSISVLLHPTDTKTGIKYSILPMDRGVISGIFTREQAEFHQDLIEKHLKGPDGARLMDRPLKYKGGIQTIFQRAESSTFFGREIGIMYVHEHIRYAESLAVTGKADAFVKALRQANPIGYREIVPSADIRQANCYYSSSDVAFKNRYEADEQYDEILNGTVTLRGGWRVYSSGPGIYITLIVSRLLGLRTENGKVIIDPVLPASMDGLSAKMVFMEKTITFRFKVVSRNFSPKDISINGTLAQFELETNPYRLGGAVFTFEKFLSLLNKPQNTIEIGL